MSSEPSLEFTRLAPELVENVVAQVSDKGDLSNIRLACKTLDKHAVKQLFKEVILSPAERHVSAWNSVSEDDVTRQFPRHAVIHTRSDVENWDWHYQETDEEEDLEYFGEALAALSKFPNLDSLEITFTPECIGRDHGMWQETAEEISEREEVLTRIFQAINDRAVDEKNRKIRKLTIINLQNCPTPEFTSSDLFRDVMGQLHELHISVLQEYNEHGPDNDYTKVELRTWPAYFCSHWLEPISKNLKALSIYNKTENWGPFPGFFDPSGISFPRLETLALGYYTLAHDNDFDWVLAITSLRKLILHNCMINSWICINNDNMAEWRVRTHDWTPMPDRDVDWQKDFSYAGTWSQRFDRIAEALPNLVDFRFDYGSSHEAPRYVVTRRNQCAARVFPQRYICFDNGILPTHWPEARFDGDTHSFLDDDFPVNMHQETLESDQKSLEALLQKLKSRS